MNRLIRALTCTGNRWSRKIGVAGLLLWVSLVASAARGDLYELLPDAKVSGYTYWTRGGQCVPTAYLYDFGSESYYAHYYGGNNNEIDFGQFSSVLIASGGVKPWVKVNGLGINMHSHSQDPRPAVATATADLKYYFMLVFKGQGPPPTGIDVPILLDMQSYVDVARWNEKDAVKASAHLRYGQYDPVNEQYGWWGNTYHRELWFNPSVQDPPALINDKLTFKEVVRSNRFGFVQMVAYGEIQYARNDYTGGEFQAWVDPVIQIDPAAEVWYLGTLHKATDLYSLQFSEGIPEPSAGILLAAGALSLIVFSYGRRRLARSRPGR